MKLYIDKPGINEKIGATTTCLELDSKKSTYSGPKDEYTIYTDRLGGIQLTLEIIEMIDYEQKALPTNIFTNHQAAITILSDMKKLCG